MRSQGRALPRVLSPTSSALMSDGMTISGVHAAVLRAVAGDAVVLADRDRQLAESPAPGPSA